MCWGTRKCRRQKSRRNYLLVGDDRRHQLVETALPRRETALRLKGATRKKKGHSLHRKKLVRVKHGRRTLMETADSHTRRQRPMTTTGSRQRAHSNDHHHDRDIEDDLAVQQERPRPVRPSTHRNTRSTPRAVEAMRCMSGNEDAVGPIRAELETIRTELREADFAKSQAQVLDRTGLTSVV